MNLLDLQSLVYFHSQYFIFFFIIFFIIYWILPNRWRNYFLLAGCYTFYGCWDYRFLTLIMASTLVDYYCAKLIHKEKSKRKRKQWLRLSIFFNIGTLISFKYFNFFLDSFNSLSQKVGLEVYAPIINIVLPLGISFYTFQTLSYTIDVFRRRIPPEESLLTFSIYVAYFPQLIAGPIERASNLIPQINHEKLLKEVEYEKGIYLFVFGLFKKIVVAGFLSHVVNNGYDNPTATGLEIHMAFFGFALLAYCDISGYTNMARGISHLLGIKLSRNFNFPFFATNPSDFWNRWHITLAHWLRDYVYFPILIKYRNPILATIITFTLVGIWHGPIAQYLYWGLLWGIIISSYHKIKLILEKGNHTFQQNIIFCTSMMFITMLITQAFYRAHSISDFLRLVLSAFSNFTIQNLTPIEVIKFLLLSLIFLIFEAFCYIIKKRDEFAILSMGIWTKTIFYLTLFFLYRNIGEIGKMNFIYFNY